MFNDETDGDDRNMTTDSLLQPSNTSSGVIKTPEYKLIDPHVSYTQQSDKISVVEQFPSSDVNSPAWSDIHDDATEIKSFMELYLDREQDKRSEKKQGKKSKVMSKEKMLRGKSKREQDLINAYCGTATLVTPVKIVPPRPKSCDVISVGRQSNHLISLSEPVYASIYGNKLKRKSMTSFGGSPLCKRHKTVSKVQSDDITPWTTTVPKEKYVTVLKEETAKASSNCRNEPEQRSITLPLSDERIDDGEIKFSDIRIHPELQTSKSDEKILSEDLKDGSASSQFLQFENQSTLAVSSKDTNGDLPLSQTVEPGNGLASVLSSKNNADALQKLIADQVNQAVIPAVAKAMVLASVSMATKTTAKEQPMTSEPPQLLDFCGQTESSAKVDEPDSSTSSTSTDREFIQLTGAHVDGIEIELNNIPNDVESLHQEQSILSPSTMVSVNSLPFKEIVAPWAISDVVPESEKISFMENVPYHTSTEDDLNVQLRAPCENRVENFQTVSAMSTRLNESRSPSHLDINTTIVDAVVANDTQKLRQEKAEREVETNLIGKNKRATVDDASIKRFSKADIFGIGPSIGCYSPGESNADVHEGSHCEYESLRTDDLPRYKLAATEQNATQSSVGLDPNENSVLDKAEIAPNTNLLGKEPTTITSTSNTSNSHSDITNIMNNTKYTVSNQESAVVFLSTAMVHKIGTSTARSMTKELRTEVPCDDVDLTCDQERSAHKAKQIMPRAELSDDQQVPEDVFAEITNLNNTLCSTPVQQDTALELAIPLVAETHLKTDICSKEQTDTTVKDASEIETMFSNTVHSKEHVQMFRKQENNLKLRFIRRPSKEIGI